MCDNHFEIVKCVGDWGGLGVLPRTFKVLMVQNRVFLDKINMKMFFHKRQVCEGEIL